MGKMMDQKITFDDLFRLSRCLKFPALRLQASTRLLGGVSKSSIYLQLYCVINFVAMQPGGKNGGLSC
jgi:hypothetical protein